MHVLRNTRIPLLASVLLLLIAACSSDPASGDDVGADNDTGNDVAVDAGGDADADIEEDADLDAGPDSTIDAEADTVSDTEADTSPDTEDDVSASTDTGETEVECTVESPETLNCESGHPELEDDGIMQLLPDGIDSAGCQFFGDRDSHESFEPITWTITGCPGETHRFQLLLDDCREESYPAYLTVEPVDTECDLSEYTQMDFSPQSGVTDMSCAELERTTFCYNEQAHEEGGGFDWTLFTREETTTDPNPWLVELEVEFEWGAHFEYQVTAEVPPLDD